MSTPPPTASATRRAIARRLQPFQAGLYAREVHGDRVIALNEHLPCPTASVAKVLTAIALYRILEREGTPDTLQLTMTEADKVPGSSLLQYMTPHQNSLFNYLVLMLVASDNTASDLLSRYAEHTEGDIVRALGMTNTFFRQTNKEVVYGEFNIPLQRHYTTWKQVSMLRKHCSPRNATSLDLTKARVSTPYDLHLMLQELVAPALIAPAHANKILTVMQGCDAGWLIKDLHVPIAMKDGGIPGVATAAGIVYTKRPFYLVFMGQDMTDDERDEFVMTCREITVLLAAYFNAPAQRRSPHSRQ